MSLFIVIKYSHIDPTSDDINLLPLELAINYFTKAGNMLYGIPLNSALRKEVYKKAFLEALEEWDENPSI